jgi:uncharacterized membrane protein YcgQ (UPF0703/DUF1980 family)
MAHDHDHHHDHDHGHNHGKEDANTYYLEQVFNIAGCGALAIIMLLHWYDGSLTKFLTPKYQPLVLTGCILLLVIVAIRAIAVWRSVAEPQAVPLHQHEHYFDGELSMEEHEHDHDHGHCDHDHSHDHGHHHHHHLHEHDHGIAPAPAKAKTLPVVNHSHHHHGLEDHGHEHGWSPMRYVVLFIPIVLYFLLPAEGFSGEGSGVNEADLNVGTQVAAKGDGQVTEIGFLQLESAARSPDLRNYYEGRTVQLTGMFVGDNDRYFTMTRYKMNCCAADALPLNAVIMLDEKSKDKIPYKDLRKKWVRVTGRVQFISRKGQGGFLPALILYPTPEEPLSKLVEEIPPDPNPYAN